MQIQKQDLVYCIRFEKTLDYRLSFLSLPPKGQGLNVMGGMQSVSGSVNISTEKGGMPIVVSDNKLT